jgi:hypothetical protein
MKFIYVLEAVVSLSPTIQLDFQDSGGLLSQTTHGARNLDFAWQKWWRRDFKWLQKQFRGATNKLLRMG